MHQACNMNCFENIYRQRRVLVTGHTGFKGSWLCRFLERLSAVVTGYSLPPLTTPNHFDQLDTSSVQSVIGDVRNSDMLREVFTNTQPEIVFHLAAQPLVRLSYREPVDTFTSNFLGTLNVLEASRAASDLRAVVIITSDKVYENLESDVGYDESSRLAGFDPYSCSKACADLLTSCYRQSFFSDPAGPLVATARAGNIIGGGDWSADRLIPDAVRAASSGTPLIIRNPSSVRPWQHVLDPLTGYLQIGQQLLQRNATSARAWNFGPAEASHVPVSEIINEFAHHWPDLRFEAQGEINAPHETSLLKINSSLAERELAWHPIWDWKQAVETTAKWYRAFHQEDSLETDADIDAYIQAAGTSKSTWVTA